MTQHQKSSAGSEREPLIGLVASLAAAISLLENTPKAKKAAASDKMFEVMLSDYRKALEAGREFARKYRDAYEHGYNDGCEWQATHGTCDVAQAAPDTYSFGTDYGKDLLTDINQAIHRGGTNALVQDCLKRCYREITRLSGAADCARVSKLIDGVDAAYEKHAKRIYGTRPRPLDSLTHFHAGWNAASKAQPPADADEAFRYARELLVSFVNEHCDPVPAWKPNDDLMGVLLQLDNALTVVRSIKAGCDPVQSCSAGTETVIGPDGKSHPITQRQKTARAVLSVLEKPDGVETLDWQIADAVLATIGEPQEAPQRDPMIAAVASLAAAISLLERTPKAKKAAPSDKMFDQMLDDYRKVLANARAALSLTRPKLCGDGQ